MSKYDWKLFKNQLKQNFTYAQTVFTYSLLMTLTEMM